MSHGPLSDLSNITRRYLDRTWFRVAGAVINVLVFSAGLAGFLMLDKDDKEDSWTIPFRRPFHAH
jgi:hypothetical protein